MAGVLSGITFLIDTIKMIFSFISGLINMIVMIFRYLITIMGLAFNVLTTLPDWLRAFCVITIAISIAYILIGRNIGKSD